MSVQPEQPPPGDPVGPLVEHLFRQEAGRLTAALTRLFGPGRLQTAEDVVQETLLKALQQWRFRGVPDNPSAWLFRVARNGALDRLRAESLHQVKHGELARDLASREWSDAERELDRCLESIEDDQLRMMFTCCHPALSREMQVTLTLKTLGGLSVREIAAAFLAEEGAIYQRLLRARRILRGEQVEFAVPTGPDLPERVDAVLEVLYLLFNEGYLAHEGEALVRVELCAEALRLTRLLTAHPAGDLPAVHALRALMCFQASRLAARSNAAGELLLLSDQDRTRWDPGLIAEGFRELDRAAAGDRVSRFHLEAGIASLHAAAPEYSRTDWKAIVELYDALIQLVSTPVIRLNRAVAVARLRGPEAGIAELERLRGSRVDGAYPLFPAVLAALYREKGELDRARESYRQALESARTGPERRFLEKQLSRLETG